MVIYALPILVIAQHLTLGAAIERAETHAFANRIADAQAEEQAAPQWQALRGVLPTVRIEAGYIRTTDPIGAFGTTLRQRRITPADFDPTHLNYPTVASNYLGALVVEQPLINVDAHLGRVAAAQAADAAEAQRGWIRSATRVSVIKVYFGAMLAREKVRTLEAAAQAGHAHVRNAEKLVAQGLATKSDVLLARVRTGEIEAELLSAAGDAKLALRHLVLVLGSPSDTTLTIPNSLPSYEVVAELLQADDGDALEQRGDVIAAAEREAAARLDVRRAQTASIPRLNAFARYDWNSPNRAFEGDENWTVGIIASWTPFAGGTDVGDRLAARARKQAAAAGLEAARAQAALEVESADVQRSIAQSRLEIARAGEAHGAEAHRIVARKYDGGLATVAELLDAAAAQTQSSLAYAHARYNGVITAAERIRIVGGDPATIVHTLDQALASK